MWPVTAISSSFSFLKTCPTKRNCLLRMFHINFYQCWHGITRLCLRPCLSMKSSAFCGETTFMLLANDPPPVCWLYSSHIRKAVKIRHSIPVVSNRRRVSIDTLLDVRTLSIFLYADFAIYTDSPPSDLASCVIMLPKFCQDIIKTRITLGYHHGHWLALYDDIITVIRWRLLIGVHFYLKIVVFPTFCFGVCLQRAF
jgi:hypothetical protein